jgi:beta-lactamase regulating signal transducer with metallopeptidase domain
VTPQLDALGWTLLHAAWQVTAITAAYRVADASMHRVTGAVRYLLAFGTLFGTALVMLATFAYELWGPPRALAIATHSWALQLAPLLLALDLFWATGVLALTLRTVGGWWWLHQVTKDRVGAVPPELTLWIRRQAKRLGIARTVELHLSHTAESPFTFGVIHNIIVVPVSAWANLPPAQLEAVLLHELAHIRRHDYFFNLVQTVIDTLLFFHPAAWWMSRHVRELREQCCDDQVLRCGAAPVDYASALLALEENRTAGAPLAMALSGAAEARPLTARIARLFGDLPHCSLDLRAAVTRLVLAALVCAALILVPLPSTDALPDTVTVDGEPTPVELPTPQPAPQPTPTQTPEPIEQALLAST